MTKPEEYIDDHHCSVIGCARIKKDLEACDSDADNETDHRQCRTEAREFSRTYFKINVSAPGGVAKRL